MPEEQKDKTESAEAKKSEVKRSKTGFEESGFTCGVCGNPIYKKPNGGLIINSHYCSTTCMHSDYIAM